MQAGEYSITAIPRVELGGVSSGLMAMPDSLPITTRKRGNPNWGRSGPFPPATATAFEMQVRQLQLTPETYVFSGRLRSWCERNRNRCYIPEWLLAEWGFRVNANLSGAA
jgi:hypothetical protein